MAFQAEQVLLGTHEHLRIHRPVRLVTTRTTLESHRGMLKCEGAALIGMTFRTGLFVASGRFHLSGIQASVGRMAIHAPDGAFLQPVPKWLGESCLSLFVTTDTELVRSPSQQVQRLFRLMDAVAVRASELILAVQTRSAAGMGFRLRVTRQAALVDVFGRGFRESRNLGPVSCIHMSLSRPVARLAALVLPALFRMGLQDLVRVLGEFPGQILVAGSARGRGDILVFRSRGRSLLRVAGGFDGTKQHEPDEDQRECEGPPETKFEHGGVLGIPSGYALLEGNDSTSAQIPLAISRFLKVYGFAEQVEEPQTAEKRSALHPQFPSPAPMGNPGYRACALSTENSEFGPWHTLHDSPRVEVFSRA